jgi:gas vesicle protein
MFNNENYTGIAMKYFILGALTGGVVALLFAPKAGYKLRKDIKKKTGDLIEDSEKYLKDAKDKANELLKDGLKNSDKLISKAKQKVNSII